MAKKKTATRKTTALAKRAPAKKAVTTALMKRRATVPAPVQELPTPPAPIDRVLTDDVAIGDYGELVDIKLTAEENAILDEPFDLSDIRIKPDGAVYAPHTKYTQKLNRAFGRLGWQLVPASRPQVGNNTVVVPYKLHVRGKPIAFGYGEQDYHANNKNQSYGDAIEATNASGLRRCCKRLGIGLELWDASFGEAFKAEYCTRVAVEVGEGSDKKVKYQWRRKQDPAFWNEKKTGRGSYEAKEERPPARDVEPVAHHGKADEPITDDQKKRLWTIARRRGRTDDEVKAYLVILGYTRSTDIKRKDYETIVANLEHPGPLPVKKVWEPVERDLREPGEDG